VRKIVCFLVAIATTLVIGGSAAASTPGSIAISVHRDVNGDVWSSSGAIADAGTMVDSSAIFAGSSSTYHGFRTFTGAEGTFTARFDVTISPTADPNVLAVTGRWAVTSGTGDYGDVHGAGWIHESFDTSVGVIAGTWTGKVVEG
jgi:hypothetical protein